MITTLQDLKTFIEYLQDQGANQIDITTEGISVKASFVAKHRPIKVENLAEEVFKEKPGQETYDEDILFLSSK